MANEEINAYAEGYEAFLCGKCESTNPYDFESDQCLEWNDGYMQAEADNED